MIPSNQRTLHNLQKQCCFICGIIGGISRAAGPIAACFIGAMCSLASSVMGLLCNALFNPCNMPKDKDYPCRFLGGAVGGCLGNLIPIALPKLPGLPGLGGIISKGVEDLCKSMSAT